MILSNALHLMVNSWVEPDVGEVLILAVEVVTSQDRAASVRSRVESLSHCSLLRTLPRAGLEELALVARPRNLAANEFLYRRGDVQPVLGVIVRGSVRISSLDEDGREAILAVLGAGSWFGDSVFCPGQPRIYDALAHEVSVVLDIPGDVFLQVLSRYPEAYPRILRLLSLRLLSVMAIVEEDALRDTYTRVGRRLLYLARMHSGDPAEGSRSVSLSLTREQFANMLGMTRQGVHAALKELAAEGLVEVGYGRLVIPDVERLQQFLHT